MNEEVRKFLAEVAESGLCPGEAYYPRIPLKDGGENSYIGLSVRYCDGYKGTADDIEGLSIFRHTDNFGGLTQTWEFGCGRCNHPYHSNKDFPLEFKTYGKTVEEAAKEAKPYLNKLLEKIKEVSDKRREVKKGNAKAKFSRLLAEMEKLKEDL